MTSSFDPIKGSCLVALLMPHSFEDLCKEEVSSFDVTKIKERPGRLEFETTLEVAYKLALYSRYASRILVEFFSCNATNKEDFYKEAITFPFEQHIDSNCTIACDCRLYGARNPAINNTMFGSQLLKDVVCDRLKAKTGSRPNVDTKSPEIRLSLSVFKESFSVALDFSGEALYKRGYKKLSTAAPLKENVAAAILKRGGWQKDYEQHKLFLDPMCGSATFSIEAAYMALNVSPQINRTKFGFLKWKHHKAALYKSLKEAAVSEFATKVKGLKGFTAIEIDKKAYEAARENIKASGLAGKINLIHGDAFKLSLSDLYTKEELEHSGASGIIAINPPYGERLEDHNRAQYIFREIGRYYPINFPHFKLLLLSGSKELSLATALRPYKTNPVKNGPINAILACYDFTDSKVSSIDPQKDSEASTMFTNRLAKNTKQFKKWVTQNHINAYRLYDADMPEYSVAIDIYHTIEDGAHLVVAEYAPPSTISPQARNRRLNIVLEATPKFLNIDPSRLHLKIRKRQKGNEQYQKVREQFNFYTVKENGLTFKVDFDRYLDTGLFLDHRLVRSLIKTILSDMQIQNRPPQFLNLFAYTCSASIYAASSNAKTTSVDLSKTYLDWGKENMRLNHFSLSDHKFVQSDALTFLETNKEKFDLIYIDPPTFSNSKKLESDFSIEKDYLNLLLKASKFLNRGGQILFSNNYRKFKLDFAALDAFVVKEITRQTIDKDFQSNKKIHQAWILSLKEDRVKK